MRTTTVLIALALFATCKAQVENNTVTATLNKNKTERPNITPEFEKLNLEDFKEGLTKEKEVDGPYKGNEFNSYSYRKINDIGTTSLNGSTIGRFAYSFTAKNSYYSIGKSYHTNMIIEGKCIISSFNNMLIIGKEYFFNKEGKLEKTVDHDLGWDFSYEKVIAYILERKLPLYRKEDESYGAEITQEGKEKKYWQLTLDTQKTTHKPTWEIVKLDAMTGEILYQIEYEGDRIYHADLHYINPKPKERIIVADKTVK